VLFRRYVAVAVMCIGVVPFMMFYYEAWDPESRNWQLWTAMKYETCTVVVVALALFLMWQFLGFANVPIDMYSYNTSLIPAGSPSSCVASFCASDYTPTVLTVSVTIPVYLVALVAFIGWFLFTIFAGVGLVALPMDLLLDYARRPEPIDLEEYAKQRMLLNERSRQLMAAGQKLGLDAHRKRDRSSVRKYNQFRQAVYFLEKDWNRVKTAYKERGGNPLKWMCSAFLGLLSAVLSVVWYLHIVLYVFITPPPTIFLNGLFLELDKVFSLFGTILYGIFSFYLLACVLKGCMKVGLRFFFIPIHPMRIGATLMNSFLFNVWLLLLCAVATVQFCFGAFQSYAQLTAIDMLLGVQVRNLQGFAWFFANNVFFYSLFGVSALTLAFLCAFPKDRRALDDE
jgi:LMBR1 domain-containing protein 1